MNNKQLTNLMGTAITAGVTIKLLNELSLPKKKRYNLLK